MYLFVQWSFFRLIILIVRTQRGFPYILVPTLLLISVSVHNAFGFLPSSTPVDKHISGACQYDRQCR